MDKPPQQSAALSPTAWNQPEILHGLLNSADVLFVMLAPSGDVLYFNDAVTAVTGTPLSEVQGQNWFAHFVPPHLRPGLEKAFSLTLAGEQPAEQTYPLQTHTGDNRLIAWQPWQIYVEGGTISCVLAMGKDITAHFQAAQALKDDIAHKSTDLQKNQQLVNSLNIVSLSLIRSTNPEDIMQTLGQELALLQLKCAIALVTPQSPDQFTIRYLSLPDPIIAAVEAYLHQPVIGMRVHYDASFDIETPGPITDLRNILAKALPTIEQDTLEQLKASIDLIDEQSIYKFPMQTQDGYLGVLAIWGPGLSTTTIPMFQTFANQVATALVNAQTLEKQRIARKQAETLQQVASILNESLDLQQVLDRILEQLDRVVPYDSASVMLIEHDDVQIMARRGLSSGIESWPPLKLESLPGIQRAINYRQPVIISDTRQDESWVRLPKDDHIRSWLGVPLIARDKIIGILNLNKGETAYYTRPDAALALAFANQAALAIQNARLFSESRAYAEELEQRVAERTRELATLYDVTAITSEPHPLFRILERVLQRTLEALACQAGGIFLADSAADLRLACEIALPAAWQQGVNLPMALVALVTETAVSGEINVHASLQLPDLPLAVTFIGTPMRVEGRNLGTLFVLEETGKHFRVEEVALLASIADHTAVAVDNANLQTQAEQLAALKERERLARELHDSVTQQLYSLRLFAEAASSSTESGMANRAYDYIQNIDEIAHQALKEMRLLLYELRSDTLLQNGLIVALRHRLDAVEQRAGVKTRLISEATLKLPPRQEEGLFRIANEALNNALKHAAAETVTVRVAREKDVILMEIQDDGSGFDPQGNTLNSGMGLQNMTARTLHMHGDIHIHSQPGQGTTILVRVPVEIV